MKEKINIKIINEINIAYKYIALLHIYNIEQIEEYYQYLNIIEKKFNIIIIFCCGNINEKIKNKYTIIKVVNKGMDIGSKFVVINYLKQKNIEYEYILCLHSKSDKIQRELYFKSLLNNIDYFFDTINKKENNIHGFFTNNVMEGDYYKLYFNNDINVKAHPLKKYDYNIWSERNHIYMNEYIKCFKLDNSNSIFCSGNCFILKKDIMEDIYNNIILYNLLNTNNSIDLSWIKVYYDYIKKNKMGNTIFDVYDYYMKHKNIYTNNLNIKNNDLKHADSMIEHIFERLYLYYIKKRNYQIKVFDSNNEDNNLSEYISEKINICLKYNIPYYKNFHQCDRICIKKDYNNETHILTIIACHTNSELKINTLIHNLKKFNNISKHIIVVNSTEFKKYEKIIKEKTKDFENKIIFDYFKNDDYICFSKYNYVINNLKNKKYFNESLKKLYKKNIYNNFILTNDSYLLINELYDFKKLFVYNYNLTTYLVSNENQRHYTDFLRRYNYKGLLKINYYYEKEMKKQEISLEDIIHNFEIKTYKLLKKRNFLFENKENLNIHFIEPYCKEYITKKIWINKDKKTNKHKI